jgi:hypothetical protein
MIRLRIARVKVLKSSLGIVRTSIIFIVDNILTDSIKGTTSMFLVTIRNTWTQYTCLVEFFCLVGFFGVKFRIWASKIIGI